MKVASLDLGSNTFILLISELKEGQIVKVFHDETRVTRLGQGVSSSQMFHPDALARAEEALRAYSEIIKRECCEQVLAVSTSAARDVKNSVELLALGQRYGIPIQIISGEKEAELTYWGTVMESQRHLNPVVIDIGGGSTEIIGFINQSLRGLSLNIGAVRLTEMFLKQHPCEANEVRALEEYLEEHLELKSAELPIGLGPAIAVAGTPTTLAMVDQGIEFDESKVNNYVLSLDKIEYWIDRMSKMSVAKRQDLTGMQPKRADVIVAGALILKWVLKKLGVNHVSVSTRGIRYGLAARGL